ncbi:MAG TPA: hypothetical protein PLJ35_02200 [Anaerolineae bacterium]|nr:hypothetical protein [Anaerolineae bacterium]HOQ97616.1 hypothetical protein [Anaerolineae bacterium]HPL26550.1 hypothetical protein [Anaerolineae bacterium]HPL26559.1 hypothetical protein [Anaerolineae bacterium]
MALVTREMDQTVEATESGAERLPLLVLLGVLLLSPLLYDLTQRVIGRG